MRVLSLSLSLCLSFFLSLCLSLSLPISPSLSFSLSLCLYIYLYPRFWKNAVASAVKLLVLSHNTVIILDVHCDIFHLQKCLSIGNIMTQFCQYRMQFLIPPSFYVSIHSYFTSNQYCHKKTLIQILVFAFECTCTFKPPDLQLTGHISWFADYLILSVYCFCMPQSPANQ